MRLLVDGLHLDVGLTQSDPSPTWKRNTGGGASLVLVMNVSRRILLEVAINEGWGGGGVGLTAFALSVEDQNQHQEKDE